MKNFLKYDGTFYKFMNKLGNLIFTSVLFILTSIPLITIIPSLSALYYVTVKTIRNENGYSSKEYLRVFKREWKSGIFLSVIFGLIGVILFIDIQYVAQSSTVFGAISLAVLNLILFIWFSLLIYMPIILSRFKLPLFKLFKLSLFILFKHLPSTILFVISFIVAGITVYLIPMPFLFVMPALLMFALSFMIERILGKYTKEEVQLVTEKK